MTHVGGWGHMSSLWVPPTKLSISHGSSMGKGHVPLGFTHIRCGWDMFGLCAHISSFRFPMDQTWAKDMCFLGLHTSEPGAHIQLFGPHTQVFDSPWVKHGQRTYASAGERAPAVGAHVRLLAPTCQAFDFPLIKHGQCICAFGVHAHRGWVAHVQPFGHTYQAFDFQLIKHGQRTCASVVNTHPWRGHISLWAYTPSRRFPMDQTRAGDRCVWGWHTSAVGGTCPAFGSHLPSFRFPTDQNTWAKDMCFWGLHVSEVGARMSSLWGPNIKLSISHGSSMGK